MQVDLTLKNYRCFPDSYPARIALRKGFTALVGPNNGGKSSLLRFFFEFRGLFAQLSSDVGLQSGLTGVQYSFTIAGVSDVAAAFSNENDRSLWIEINFLASAEEQAAAIGFGDLPTRMVIEVARNQNVFRVTELRTATRNLGTDPNYRISTSGGQRLLVDGRTSQTQAHIEPMMRALAMLASTTYLGAFRNAINVGGREDFFDILVGEQFLRAWRQLKTGNTRRSAKAIFDLTDDIRRIFGFNQMEMNTSDDNRRMQVFVDGQPFWLDELGSGVAQFILVLTSLATREQAYILIDEPELNLHPSLQIDFLTTIGSYASEGVIFATHAMGLARAVGQQIYALKRLREGVSEMKPLEGMPRLPEFLGELSFSGYRELGFQKILLVEGPTDVTTMQQFLRKRSLDHTVVVLPLGGATMINANRETELAEMKRISTDIHVLIDSERDLAGAVLDGQRQAFIATCGQLQINCYILERRAMENYLSDRAIKIVKGPAYRALTSYERLQAVNPAWSKRENWRIAREMTLDELKETDLGQFLNSL